MKRFEIREFGVDKIALAELDTPKPGPGHVLVKMSAASLNYRDLLVVKGLYNPKLRMPMVPLSDGVGTVAETGEGVTRVKSGDLVCGCFMQAWIEGPPTKEKGNSALGGAMNGVLSEYVLFSEQGLVLAPASLSDVEAATLPCAAVTAWHALFEGGGSVPGETVLMQGTGGVSLFALQLAAAAGLETIVISSSDEKLARAKELGAHERVNYKREPNWEEAARKITNGRGVDNVIEVGGSDTLPHSLKAVRIGGVISVIGMLGGTDPVLSPTAVLMNSIRMQGIYVGSRRMFEKLNRAIELHRINPVVDRVFGWTEIKEALQYMEKQEHFGKICLQF